MTRLLISMPGDTERNPHLIFFLIIIIQPA